jgi:hypothetical protein
MVAILAALCVPAPGRPTTWYVDASATEGGNGRSWETAFRAIRAALNHAWIKDTIVVAEGTYIENIRVRGSLVLRSADPLNPAVVANTIIDGGGTGPVIEFGGEEGATCVVEGFTITNGATLDGGGISGNGTLATIRNNIITGNVAHGADEAWFEDPESEWDGSGAMRGGGGIYWCNGLIENNTISDNTAGALTNYEPVGFGGGLCRCHGTIRNNRILRNRALGYVLVCGSSYWCLPVQAGGGGLAHCNGIIERNYIADNTSEYDGGGLYSCGGLIEGNIIARNGADWYSGGLRGCGGWIRSNLIMANFGDGLMGCSALIENNVIWGNSRKGISSAGSAWIRNTTISGNSKGGVAELDNGLMHNCIIWQNGGSDPAVYWTEPTYSCIQDWAWGGEGNISEAPRFVDAENGDFRLLPDSPCIDAGFNSPELPDFDIAGMHRIMFGGKSLTVDMGAYEFYINKLDPVLGTNEAVFTWSSLADKTYSIFYTDDLCNWHIAIANFPSSGNQTTSWLDDGSLTGIPPLLAPKRFYRLLENP